MYKIDNIIIGFLEGLGVENIRIFSYKQKDQYLIGNDKSFAYDTVESRTSVVQAPKFGICHTPKESIDAMAAGISSFNIVQYLYYRIYNRNFENKRARNYSFKAPIDVTFVAESLQVSKRTVYNHMGSCVEMGFVLDEEDGQYSLNPVFCPWRNIMDVLEWNEDDIYRRTHNEPGGLKRRYIAKKLVNFNDYDIPVEMEYASLTGNKYKPSPMDFISDYIRTQSDNGQFPLSAGLVVSHAKDLGFDVSRSSISKALPNLIKSRAIQDVGLTRDRCKLYRIADEQQSLAKSDKIDHLKDVIDGIKFLNGKDDK